MNQACNPYSSIHPVARRYAALTTAPVLLPGEDLGHYESLRDAVIREIEPQTAIEWLFVSDLVDLSWDILRYRRLRQKVLDASRELAILAIQERIDLAGIEEDALPRASHQIKKNVAAWRTDPQAEIEIESRLVAHRVDTESINLEAFSQGQELYLLFDTLLNSAQSRRILLLREIETRRIGKRRVTRF
jgi:hypothetical protein